MANVSHELRTPLTAIRASSETLLDGALKQPEQAARFVEMILRHARRLEELSRDLLQLAQLEAGLAAPGAQAVSVADLAGRALEAVRELAARREVAVELRLPERPLFVAAASRLLEQALVNLLDNAVKYGGPGSRVTLALESRPPEVALVVSDDGPGIAPEHLERIFERFYRLDRDRSRELGGTGLGLAIVKHIAQAHGGRVEVESRLGRGSVFRLILPEAVAAPRAAVAPKAVAAREA